MPLNRIESKWNVSLSFSRIPNSIEIEAVIIICMPLWSHDKHQIVWLKCKHSKTWPSEMTITMRFADLLSFFITFATRHMEFVACTGKCCEYGVGIQIRCCAAFRREFCGRRAVDNRGLDRDRAELTIVWEDFYFAETQTALDAHQLNGNILTDEWTGTGEWFGGAFV